MLGFVIPLFVRLVRFAAGRVILAAAPSPPPAANFSQLLVDHLLNPAVPIFQVLALFFGVTAAVHAIASHHGEESAALLLVKPAILTVAVEGFLVVLQNAASLATGGGLGF